MQIFIDLLVGGQKQKLGQTKLELHELLKKLESSGYRINTLYGNLIYDIAKNEVIDCGEPGKIVPITKELIDAIFATGAKAAVIFTKEKYLLFVDTYFVIHQFCNQRKVRPLSTKDVLSHYDELVIYESKTKLDSLCAEQFNNVN